MPDADPQPPSVFRPGGLTYLRIPAPDPGRSAAFYTAVFGWQVRGQPGQPGFTDGSGHVIGHLMPDLPVAGAAGLLPYIYVDRIDEAIGLITAHGGQLVSPPDPEGDLWVATFFDPAGNLLGVWQHGPRG
jgi:uncharacterized protein